MPAHPLDQIRPWKGALASLLAVAILVACFAAMDRELHEGIHAGNDCEDSATCVIAMFGAGAIGAAPTEAAVAAAPRQPGEMAFPGERLFTLADRQWRPSARGPPVRFLFGR